VGYAALSVPGGAKIRVESVAALRDLPQPDLTGDGYPDVWFETAFDGHRCCHGTLVYSLGLVPDKALESSSAPLAPFPGWRYI